MMAENWFKLAEESFIVIFGYNITQNKADDSPVDY